MRYFLHHKEFYHASGLFSPCINDFSFFYRNRYALTRDKAIVDRCIAFGENGIHRYQFLVMYLQHIIYFDEVNRHRMNSIFFYDVDSDRKERPEVPVKRNRLVRPVLQPAAYEHKEHDAAHTVQIAGTSIGENLIQTAAECNQQCECYRCIDVEVFTFQAIPGIDKEFTGTIRDDWE